MTNEHIKRAWRDGLDLQAALYLFDPKIDPAELAEMTAGRRQTIEIGKGNLREAGIDFNEALFDSIAELQSHFSKITREHQSRIDQLIHALELGDLIALGFSADRPRAAAPERVPYFLIQQRLANFRKSEFSDGGHRYSNVRIVEASSVPKPKIGRPSIRKLVFELAEELKAKDEIAPDMLPKVQVGKIQTLAKFSADDQTIRRHLKSFWEANLP